MPRPDGGGGYTESTATGLLAGVNMARMLADLPPLVPPVHSMLGALSVPPGERSAASKPMNANFGLLDDLEQPIRDKRERKVAMANPLGALDAWCVETGIAPVDTDRAAVPA
ncbi:MAG: hypothetical protein U0163_12305 [Gemmatimonadaceae bacterium]